VKLPDIMKAKKKPMETIAIDELGVNTTPSFESTRVEAPTERQKGVIVKDVAELVDALKQKGLLT
jgi:electron transfer flavoprotein beta subunit